MRENTQRFTDGTAAFLAGDPDAIPGDCWRTAIASLLDLDRDEVPHFVAEHPEPGPAWWFATVAFVEEQRPGWTLVNLEPTFPVYQDPDTAPAHVVVTGRSPRGDWFHSVVGSALTGETVWDPHPSRAGILDLLDVAALVAL